MSDVPFKSKIGTYIERKGGYTTYEGRDMSIGREGKAIEVPLVITEKKTDSRKEAERIILSGELERVMDCKISVAKIQAWYGGNREWATNLKAIIVELLKECAVTVRADKINS